MHTPQIVPVHRDAYPALGETLARAFHNDPVWMHLTPDAARRPAQLQWLFSRWVALMATLGESYMAEDASGAALWVPCGGKKLGSFPLAGLAVRAPFTMGPGWMKRMSQMMRDADKRRAEEVTGAAWELNTLGVHPDANGRGIGGALLRSVLNRVDAAGQTVYVQTHNPENIPFYERYGFTLIRSAPTFPGGNVFTCSLLRKR